MVVSDGHLLEHNLKALGRDRAWLDKCLKARGCKGGYRSVFLMLVDRADGVYLVQKS